MKNLIYLIVLFAAPFFFSITAILGLGYYGEAGDNTYRFYCIACFLIGIFTFLSNYIHQNHPPRNFISILIITIFVVVGALSDYTSDKSWLCLVAFCLPSTFIGIYYANRRSVIEMEKWLDVVALIITIALPIMVYRLNVIRFEGGGSYSQSLSYYAALCFLINLFILKYGHTNRRFSFFRTYFYKLFVYFMFTVYVLVILVSGGRGGFVTLFLGIFVFLLTFRGSRLRMFGLILSTAMVGIIVSVSFLICAEENILTTFEENSERVFSYLSSSGIDMNETSGRNSVFEKSIRLFNNSPIIGYGLFSYKEILDKNINLPYPHNLFLEWLLQGGLLLCTIGLFILYMFITRLKQIIKENEDFIIILPFVIYPFTMLMYTGSYMEEPFFWFCMTLVFNYKLVNFKNKKLVSAKSAK